MDITRRELGLKFSLGSNQHPSAQTIPDALPNQSSNPIPKKLFKDLISLILAEHPEVNYAFLDEKVYTAPLTAEERQQYAQLLGFVRTLQSENSVYETIYHHLLHLYVLNGSRLDLLKTVDRRLRGLAEGQGALLLIGGVSGSGKTSLALAFQERVHQLGARFISGRCSEQERASYAVWQGVARSASAAGFALETLSAPIGDGPEAQSSQHLEQSMADWLNYCTTSQPLVILLDDLHWADVDSLEVLNYLTGQPTPIPVLFVATYRSEETHLKHALYDYLPRLQRNRLIDLIQLEPLTHNDLERFAIAELGACKTELVAYLYERAEGHPLFTSELLHDLMAHDLLTQDAQGHWLPPTESVSVPVYLKQLITRRVSRLGDNAQRLLSIAAVAGEAWPLKIIEPLAEMAENELLDALESALRAGIISTEDDQAEIYRFSHGLIREVLYTGQIARRRKRTHAQIAAQFEQQQPENVFAIAYHYVESEQWEKAVAYCLAAGEQSSRRIASYSALQWYQQALNAAERAGKASTPAVIFEIYERLGRTHLALGQREVAEILYSRMRDVAQSNGDLIAEGQALVHLAQVRSRRYQLDLAEKTAYEALKIGEQAGDLHLMINIHACLGCVLITLGQMDQAATHFSEVMKHAELLGDSGQLLDVLRLSVYQAIWLGQYQKAETFAQQTIKLAKETGDSLTIAGAYQNLAFVQIESGQFHAAYQTINNTLEAIGVSGSHHYQEPRLLNMMGYLHLELGGAEEALTWDQKALAAIHDTQAKSIEMRRYSLLNKATDYLHLDKPDEAQDTIIQFEAVKEGVDFVHFRYFNRYQLLLCELYLTQNKFEQALELAQEARVLAQSKGVLKNMAKSHWFEGRALAGLWQFDKALEHLEKAVTIVDKIRHGSLRWKIRLSLAKTLQMAGESAEGVIRQARALMDETIQVLAESPLMPVFLASDWMQQIEALEQNPIPASPTYPASLTAREVEVLQLVANGASNQQVADVLHISVRTVNTHMTNILNKTGCENRTAASVFAIQHHLVST